MMEIGIQQGTDVPIYVVVGFQSVKRTGAEVVRAGRSHGKGVEDLSCIETGYRSWIPSWVLHLCIKIGIVWHCIKIRYGFGDVLRCAIVR